MNRLQGFTNLIFACLCFPRLRICAEYFQLSHRTCIFPDSSSALICAPRRWIVWMHSLDSLAIWLTWFDSGLAIGRHWQEMRGMVGIKVGLVLTPHATPPPRTPFLEEAVLLREYSSCPEGCPSGSQRSQDSSNTISSLCFQFRREKYLLL